MNGCLMLEFAYLSHLWYAGCVNQNRAHFAASQEAVFTFTKRGQLQFLQVVMSDMETSWISERIWPSAMIKMF